MRTKILIISSFFLLAFFAIAAHAFADSVGKSADQLIAGDQIDTTPEGVSSTPQASRDAQVGQKGKEILNVTMGQKLNSVGYNPSEGFNAKDTRALDLAETSPAQNSEANTTTSAQSQEVPTIKTASVSGGWSLKLIDSSVHTAALTLFQNGDAVFGSGNINMDDNTTLTATACGTLTDNDLNMDLMTLGKVNLYRLVLTVSGESAAGNYTAYSPSGTSSMGTAKGTVSVPSS